ncbi:aspartate/glutamate racemase family protein [Sphingomicrobium lutaoense]|uniref:Aspartate racemase n=1 Tax=Sphingomicrobium lutaoense TaxID=515949 RepID=A0A839YWB7_9SPHN|nr:amino acid racemase [Sphingomicrobium lutaoense]MBB3763489.1 aspartate racemase [Sphingomicrobium lutaoense]
MKKLGLIGGTSWNSTALYYDHINRLIARRLGGLSSARMIIESIDLAPYAAAQQRGDVETAQRYIVAAGLTLVAGGAEAIMIASNTTHKYAPAVEEATKLPLLHIADPTIARLKADGRRRVALLGTRFTMTEPFARERYEAAGIEIMNISPDWIATVDRIIFSELARGEVRRDSQRAFKTLLTELARAQADAVVLGCTELVLAVDARANVLPVYDTTEIHARHAVEWMLGDEARAAA